MPSAPTTSTALLASRRRASAVRSSLKGARTGSGAAVPKRLTGAARVSGVLAYKSADLARVSGELRDVVRLHDRLSRRCARRPLRDDASVSVHERLELSRDVLPLRPLDGRPRTP